MKVWDREKQNRGNERMQREGQERVSVKKKKTKKRGPCSRKVRLRERKGKKG